MLLYLSLIGIFLSVILISYNAGKFKSTLYLGVFFFLISLFGLNQYALLDSKSVLLVSIFCTNFAFLHYLIGPVLYWYIRSVLTDNSRLKKTDLFHLIPSMIYLIASLPFIFSSYAYKVQIATEIVKDAAFLGSHKFTLLSEILPIYIVYLSRPVHLFIYTLWSIGLFICYLIQKGNRKVFTQQNFMNKWLSVFLLFQTILISTYLISTFKTFIQSSDVFFTLNFLQFLSGAGLIGLLISPFFFPGILYGLPHIPEPNSKVNEEEKPDSLSVESKKSAPNFEAEYILAIQKKADSCMQEFQTFLLFVGSRYEEAVRPRLPGRSLRSSGIDHSGASGSGEATRRGVPVRSPGNEPSRAARGTSPHDRGTLRRRGGVDQRARSASGRVVSFERRGSFAGEVDLRSGRDRRERLRRRERGSLPGVRGGKDPGDR